MRATSSILRSSVSTLGWLKTREWKRETVEKWHWKTRNRQALLNSAFNKSIWRNTSGPCKLKTINCALRHQCRYAIQFKINNNNNNNNNSNDIFTVLALQISRRASVTPHITFLVPVVIQLLVSRIERHKQWRRSLWDRGDMSPQYLLWGDMPINFPPISVSFCS